MTDGWSWEYDPDERHVVAGLPGEAVIEVERLAGQLAILGRDALDAGRGRLEGGGLRTLDLFGGRGFLTFLVIERLERVFVVRVVWYG
ncbi:hypothetical protein [Streptomyces sp. ICBB 8177]|uniref:hypothetical protein n=1 Tax=Streptomyces sp. ICBB 8177 TaxID=563922 RepID=UPI000D67BD26|nr:hypothetical protein [Streptomyces sp. ICBB 8177]PWI43802.1 hypothetical protein CK485_17070 [Streptomyces sp. ICBB 8177]